MNTATGGPFLVMGGELKAVGKPEFAAPDKLHVVGVFADGDAAHAAWSAAARATIDDAQMRYFLLDLSTLLAAAPPR